MKNLYYTLDENKNPVAVDMWTYAAAHKSVTHVGDDTVEVDGEKVRVSTVFLGLNHAWNDEEPVLFETMIFGGEHDQFQERYHTWTEAENGHKKALAMLFEVQS